jgi:hypothetical protein
MLDHPVPFFLGKLIEEVVGWQLSKLKAVDDDGTAGAS